MAARTVPRIPDPRVTPTLSVPEAGRILGIGRSAAYEAVKSGDIPAIKVGRSVRVPTARLLALLGLRTDNPS